jgi:hypothetical protein
MLAQHNADTLLMLQRHIYWNDGWINRETAEDLCSLHHQSGTKGAAPHLFVSYAIRRGWLHETTVNLGVRK